MVHPEVQRCNSSNRERDDHGLEASEIHEALTLGGKLQHDNKTYHVAQKHGSVADLTFGMASNV